MRDRSVPHNLVRTASEWSQRLKTKLRSSGMRRRARHRPHRSNTKLWSGQAQFSSDGQRVVTASDDKTARVWDANTGQALTGPLKHEAVVRSVQFSSDGQRVVTASDD